MWTYTLFTHNQISKKTLSCNFTQSWDKNPPLGVILHCEILEFITVIASHCTSAASRAFYGTNVYVGINRRLFWLEWLTCKIFIF